MNGNSKWDWWGQIGAKLGSCSRCMRQSFNGAALGWAGVTLVYLVLPAPGWPLTTALLAASLLTLWWLAHVARFTLRRLRALAHYRRSTGLDSSRRGFFSAGSKTLATALLLSAPAACSTLLPKSVAAKIVWCDCYFDADCGHFFYCRYDVDCSWVPKGTGEDDEDGRPPCPGISAAGSCDGLCKFLKLPYSTVSRTVLAEVADLYFRAYLRAAKGTTRNHEPDRELLAKARAIPLPDDGHKVLTGAIFSTLDLTAGWDFAIGLRDMNDPQRPGIDGFFRGLPEGQVAIIEAARTGFVDTIRSGKAEAILPPLRAFWEGHPQFKPNHGGRCYPHGHLEYKTAQGCQEVNLMKIATALAAADAA